MVPILEISWNSLFTNSRQRRDKETRKEANSRTTIRVEISPPSRGRKGTARIGNEVLKSDEWSTVIREIGDDSFRVDERNERASFGRVICSETEGESERNQSIWRIYPSEEFKTSSISPRDFNDFAHL